MAAVVAEELGRDPADVFDGFDPADPIASASIAQVHRCRLRSDGSEVVLKVQRPGVRALLLQDLEDLDAIVTLVAGAEPEFDFHPMLDAWMEMVPLETDFVHEMRNSKFVAGALDAAKGTCFETRAFVPDIVEEHTTARLMCIRYIDGCSIRELDVLDARAVDRDLLIAEITKAFALQVHALGKWSGDPHPGNILVELGSEGTPWRPGLIDFGITVELTDAQRLGFCRTVCAAAENDSYNLLQSFADMDIVLNRADPVASMETIRHLFRSTASRDETRAEDKRFMTRAKAREAANVDSGIAVDRRGERGEQDRLMNAVDADAGKGDDPSRGGVEAPGLFSRLRNRVLGGSGGAESAKGAEEKLVKAAKVKNAGKGQRRSPVDAYPGFLVFLFRTLGLLRGLSTKLGVEHAYLPLMYGVARKALEDAVPADERITQVVYPLLEPPSAADEWAPGYRASMASRRSKKLRKVLTRVIEELDRRKLLIGVQVAAFLDGKIVLDLAAGRIAKHNYRPVTPSTLFCPFSATKGVCAILFAELADEHGIEPTDLVSEWWPAYACHGKETTTVAMLLGHQAGLAQEAPEDMRMVRLRDDWQGIVDWLASSAKPAHPPGEKSVYHALNFGWLVAGMLQQVSGTSIQERLRALSEKMGVSGEMYIGMPHELSADVPNSRVASLTSELMSDIEKMFNMREKSRSSVGERDGASDSGAGGGGGGDDGPKGENMDALYDEDNSAGISKGIRFAFERILTQSTPTGNPGELRNVAKQASSDDVGAPSTDASSPSPAAGSKIGQEEISEFLKKTPYLVEPSFFSHPVLREAVVPAANGHMTARALAKMYSMLAQDGKLDGKEILQPGRVAKMMEVHRPIQVPTDSNQGEFCAGFAVYDCLDRRGRPVKEKAIGHQGIGGSVGFCVPSKKFSMAFMCNQMNAFSAAGAVIVATVCAVLNVPAPRAYSGLMHKLREDGVESVEDVFESLGAEVDAALSKFDIMQAMTGQETQERGERT